MGSPLRTREFPYLRSAAEIGAHVDELAEREALLATAVAAGHASREKISELERVRFEIEAYLELLEELDNPSPSG